MMAIALGAFSILASLYGIFLWRAELLQFLKGTFPLTLFCAGVIAILAGIHSFKKK